MTWLAVFLLPGGVMPVEGEDVVTSWVNGTGTYWIVEVEAAHLDGAWYKAAQLPRRFPSQTLREIRHVDDGWVDLAERGY